MGRVHPRTDLKDDSGSDEHRCALANRTHDTGCCHRMHVAHVLQSTWETPHTVPRVARSVRSEKGWRPLTMGIDRGGLWRAALPPVPCLQGGSAPSSSSRAVQDESLCMVVSVLL